MTDEKREEIQKLQKLNTELDHIGKFLIDSFITAGSNKEELPEKWVAETLLLRTRERIEEEAPEVPVVEEPEENPEDMSEEREEEFFKTFEHFVSIQKISDMLREFAYFLETEHEFVVLDKKVCFSEQNSNLDVRFFILVQIT